MNDIDDESVFMQTRTIMNIRYHYTLRGRLPSMSSLHSIVKPEESAPTRTIDPSDS